MSKSIDRLVIELRARGDSETEISEKVGLPVNVVRLICGSPLGCAETLKLRLGK